MIFDDFKFIDLYNIEKNISDFILNINPEIQPGRYTISENAYINIDEYETKEEPKLEAHRKHIDIQFVIKGCEKVFVCDNNDLEILEPYNIERDVEFYKTPKRLLNTLYLTKGKFLLLYPNDVHAPCIHFDGEKSKVKKGIVKIKI